MIINRLKDRPTGLAPSETGDLKRQVNELTAQVHRLTGDGKYAWDLSHWARLDSFGLVLGDKNGGYTTVSSPDSRGPNTGGLEFWAGSGLAGYVRQGGFHIGSTEQYLNFNSGTGLLNVRGAIQIKNAQGNYESVQDYVSNNVGGDTEALNKADQALAILDGKLTTYTGNADPSLSVTPTEGDFWIKDQGTADKSDDQTFVWRSGAWVETGSSSLIQAILKAQTAKSVADGKIDFFVSATQPTNGAEGDLWLNISYYDHDGNAGTAQIRRNELYRHDGTTWVSIRDSYIDVRATTAYNDAVNAANQYTTGAVDGLITTYYATTAPVQGASDGKGGTYDLHEGDLWYDTDDKRAHRYNASAAGTGADPFWVPLKDADIQNALDTAQDAKTTADGKIRSFYQNSEPVRSESPVGSGKWTVDHGDLWVDTTPYDHDGDPGTPLVPKNELHSYVVGTGWVSVWDVRMDDVSSDLSNALDRVSVAEDRLDKKINTFYQDNEPVQGKDPNNIDLIGHGDLWLDTTKVNAEGTPDAAGSPRNVLHRWDSTAAAGAGDWLIVQDEGITRAIVNAQSAQSTADKKIQTFYVTTAPVHGASDGQGGTYDLGFGDLWIDTDDKNKLHRYNPTANPKWVPVRDLGIQEAIDTAEYARALADGEIQFFYDTVAPVEGGVKPGGGTYPTFKHGDYWVETDNNNYLSKWNDDLNVWQAANNDSLAGTILRATKAQATADGKVTTYFGGPGVLPPTSELSDGDLWIDTGNKNEMKRWDASANAGAGAWVTARDGTIADAATTADWGNVNKPDRFKDAPTGDGLFLTDTHMGFHKSSTWKTYMDNSGNFYLNGSGTHGLTWSAGAGLLTVTGNIHIKNPGNINTQDLNNNAGWTDNTVANRAIARLDGNFKSFFQTTAPTTGMAEGDFWFDTDDNDKAYVYRGSAWALAGNNSLAQAIYDAQTAQTTADGRAQAFVAATAPLNNAANDLQVGDIWLDVSLDTGGNPKNTLRIWSGTGWVLAHDETALAQAEVAITNASTAQAKADEKVRTFFGATAPTRQSDGSGGWTVDGGDLWFDQSLNGDGKPKNILKHYVVGGSPVWQAVQDQTAVDAFDKASTAQAAADKKIQTFYSATQPANNQTNNLGIGDLWVNTSITVDTNGDGTPDAPGNKLYRWSGSAWQDISDARIDVVAANAAEAIDKAATADAKADGKVRTFFDTTGPTRQQDVNGNWSVDNGDLWINTSLNTDGKPKNILHRYVLGGTPAWQSVQDQSTVDALSKAQSAEATADKKIQTFYLGSEPADNVANDLGVGDLWINTADNNKLYRYNPASTPKWVLVRDQGIQVALDTAEYARALVDGEIDIYYADAAPVPGGAKPGGGTYPATFDYGDYWVETDNNNALKKWNTSTNAWVAADNDSLAGALVKAGTAQSIADGKVTTYVGISSSLPATSKLSLGDLWIDTANRNEMKRWSGSAWVSIRDGEIAEAAKTAIWDNVVKPPRFNDVPPGTGLSLTSTHMGYRSAGSWKTYMDDSGNFYLTGAGTHGLTWSAGAGTLAIAGTITILGGSGIDKLSDAGALAKVNNLDGVPEGTTYKRTTANEKTGASRAFGALDSSNAVKTRVLPGSTVGTPSGSGLFMGSDYLGYYKSGTGWATYMDSTGKFYLKGTGTSSLDWDGSTLTVEGTVRATSGWFQNVTFKNGVKSESTKSVSNWTPSGYVLSTVHDLLIDGTSGYIHLNQGGIRVGPLESNPDLRTGAGNQGPYGRYLFEVDSTGMTWAKGVSVISNRYDRPNDRYGLVMWDHDGSATYGPDPQNYIIYVQPPSNVTRATWNGWTNQQRYDHLHNNRNTNSKMVFQFSNPSGFNPSHATDPAPSTEAQVMTINMDGDVTIAGRLLFADSVAGEEIAGQLRMHPTNNRLQQWDGTQWLFLDLGNPGTGGDATTLGGHSASAYPRKSENAEISGTWTHKGLLKLYTANNVTSDVLRIGDRDSDYGFRFRYTGAESGANNTLELWGDNDLGSDMRAFRVHNDGKITFDQTMTTRAVDVDGTLNVKGGYALNVQSATNAWSLNWAAKAADPASTIEVGEYHQFRVSGSTRPVIFTHYDLSANLSIYEGKVGIAKASPTVALDVNGSAHVSGYAQVGTNVRISDEAPIYSGRDTLVQNRHGSVWQEMRLIDGSGTEDSGFKVRSSSNSGTNWSDVFEVTRQGATMHGGMQYFRPEGDGMRVYENVLHYSADLSTITGAWILTIPAEATNSATMLVITIDGYDYGNSEEKGGPWRFVIGGYNFNDGANWYQPTVETQGRPPTRKVRLCKKSDSTVIVLGDDSTVWSYPKIAVTRVIAGYSNEDKYRHGWSSTISTFSTTGWTVVEPVPVLTHYKTRIGINNRSPEYSLDVVGTTRSTGTITSNAQVLADQSFASRAGTGASGVGHFKLQSPGSSSSLRFQLGLLGTEVGSSGGSDFALWRYDVDGGYLGTPMTVSRATGQTHVREGLLVTGDTTMNHRLYVNSVSSDTQILVGRVSGMPSIESSTAASSWLMLDGNRGASGKVGVNYYSSGDVYLASGGGRVRVGDTTAPAYDLDVSGTFRATSNAQIDGNFTTSGYIDANIDYRLDGSSFVTSNRQLRRVHRMHTPEWADSWHHNVLLGADRKFTVTQTGSTTIDNGPLFDGAYSTVTSLDGIDPANPWVLLIENIASKYPEHTQLGGQFGWTSRYWYPIDFKVEIYDSYNNANVWRTLANVTGWAEPQYLVDLRESTGSGAVIDKVRFTVTKAAGSAGTNGHPRMQLNEVFFLHQEAQAFNPGSGKSFYLGGTLEVWGVSTFQSTADFNGAVNVRGPITIDQGQTSTLTILSNDDGASVLELKGGSQGTGRLYVGQSSSHGGGIEYNGDNSPGTTGAGADYITLWRRDNGSDSWTARNKFSSNDWEFRGNLIGLGGITSGTSSSNANITAHGDFLPGTSYKHNIGSTTNKWLTGHLAELWVSTLVASEERSTIGGRFTVGNATVLTEAISTSSTTIKVKHNNLSSGHVIHLEARGQVEFMSVSGSATGTGPYQYTVVRNLDGSGANAWNEGDGVFNTGTTGSQFIDLSAANSLLTGASIGGAALTVWRRTGTTYSAIEPIVRLGELNSTYGYTVSTPGLAIGAPSGSNITVDVTNGIRFRTSTTTLGSISSSEMNIGSLRVNSTETSVEGTLKVNSHIYVAKDVSVHNSSGRILIGNWGSSGQKPHVKVVGTSTSEYVQLYYNDSGDWGIRGAKTGNSQLFNLGSDNVIAGWNIDSNLIYSGNIQLAASGGVKNTLGTWALNNDGSGNLGGKAVQFDSNGFYFQEGASLRWSPDIRDRNIIFNEGYRLDWRDGDTTGVGNNPGDYPGSGERMSSKRTIGPFGVPVWTMHGAGPAAHASGWIRGMRVDLNSLDTTKTYRIAVFFKCKNVESPDYRLYMGGSSLRDTGAGAISTNPYYIGGKSMNYLSDDEWYMAVGVLHPLNYAGSHTGVAGIYHVASGEQIEGGGEWEMTDSTDIMRIATYNSGSSWVTTGNEEVFFWEPTVQVMDGTEPSLRDLMGLNTTMVGRNSVRTGSLVVGKGSTLPSTMGHELYAWEGVQALDTNTTSPSFSKRHSFYSPIAQKVKIRFRGRDIGDLANGSPTVWMNGTTKGTGATGPDEAIAWYQVEDIAVQAGLNSFGFYSTNNDGGDIYDIQVLTSAEGMISAKMVLADSLSALSANLGNITAGTISIYRPDWQGGQNEWVMYLNPTSQYALVVGSEDYQDAPFYVQYDGTLKSTKGLIAGWTISSSSLTSQVSGKYTGMRPGGTTAFFAGATDALGSNSKIRLNHDGSASLASGKISWDAAGVTSLSDTFLRGTLDVEGTFRLNGINITGFAQGSTSDGIITLTASDGTMMSLGGNLSASETAAYSLSRTTSASFPVFGTEPSGSGSTSRTDVYVAQTQGGTITATVPYDMRLNFANAGSNITLSVTIKQNGVSKGYESIQALVGGNNEYKTGDLVVNSSTLDPNVSCSVEVTITWNIIDPGGPEPAYGEWTISRPVSMFKPSGSQSGKSWLSTGGLSFVANTYTAGIERSTSEVYGNRFKMHDSNASASGKILYLRYVTSGTESAEFEFKPASGSSSFVRLTKAGAISTSDARLKSDMRDLGDERSMLSLDGLRPVEWQWTDKARATGQGHGFTWGYVAQDLLGTPFAQFVHEVGDYLYIAQHEMAAAVTPLLVIENRRLRDSVAKLEVRVSQLESQIRP